MLNDEPLDITVFGAGGKMGMRISANLDGSGHTAHYSETHAAAQERVVGAGREISDGLVTAAQSDVVILAVPDVVLGAVSAEVVPRMKPGAVLLTLDPAAAYAGLLAQRDDIHFACAHPCHPSVFLHRPTEEQHADTFGGIAAPQDVVAAMESGDEGARAMVESVIRTIYGPVLDVHWVTVHQLAVLEPTLVETVTCMIGGLLAEALAETVTVLGVPEAAARAMLLGHVQIALSNSLRGSNSFSEGCLIAMDYGRGAIVRDDWKRIFERSELDGVIAQMLKVDRVRAGAAT